MFAKKPAPVKKNKQRQGMPAWFWMLFGAMMTLGIGLFLYLWNPLKHTQQSAQDAAQPETETQIGQQSEQAAASATKPKKQDSEYEFYDLLPEQKVNPIPDEVIITKTDADKPKKADVTIDLPTTEFDNDTDFSPSGQQSEQTIDGDGTSSQSASVQVIPKASISRPLPSPVEELADSEETYGGEPVNEGQPEVGKQVIGSTTDPIADKISELSKTSYILQVNSYGSAEQADKRRAEVLLAGVDARVVRRTGVGGETLYQVITKPYDNKTAAFTALDRLQVSGIDALVVERKN